MTDELTPITPIANTTATDPLPPTPTAIVQNVMDPDALDLEERKTAAYEQDVVKSQDFRDKAVLNGAQIAAAQTKLAEAMLTAPKTPSADRWVAFFRMALPDAGLMIKYPSTEVPKAATVADIMMLEFNKRFPNG